MNAITRESSIISYTRTIVERQRMSTEDSPDLCITVFFKGCPFCLLRCHNVNCI